MVEDFGVRRTTQPIAPDRDSDSARAVELGRHPCSVASSRTRALVDAETPGFPDSALDTADLLTPASRARSAMVTRFFAMSQYGQTPLLEDDRSEEAGRGRPPREQSGLPCYEAPTREPEPADIRHRSGSSPQHQVLRVMTLPTAMLASTAPALTAARTMACTVLGLCAGPLRLGRGGDGPLPRGRLQPVPRDGVRPRLGAARGSRDRGQDAPPAVGYGCPHCPRQSSLSGDDRSAGPSHTRPGVQQRLRLHGRRRLTARR